MLDGLPTDVLLCVCECLVAPDRANVRRCCRSTHAALPWSGAHVRRWASAQLRLPSRGRRPPRVSCAECPHDCMTYIEWTPELRRSWIPWCHRHVCAFILDDVILFCQGSTFPLFPDGSPPPSPPPPASPIPSSAATTPPQSPQSPESFNLLSSPPSPVPTSR